jgi:hypothetical protein
MAKKGCDLTAKKRFNEFISQKNELNINPIGRV